MHIGLTYDTRIMHSQDEGLPPDFYGEYMTEDEVLALETALQSLGHEVLRIGNAKDLCAFLAEGRSVDCVFNMAEGRHGRSREAWIPAMLEAFDIPYVFSDPATLCLCLDKSLAKHIWRSHGLPTPAFALIADPRDLETATLPPFPLFVKPSSEGTSKGISSRSIVHSPAALAAQVMEAIVTYRQPALVEAFLPGREFTVGVLGNHRQARALGAAEVVALQAENAAAQVYGFIEKEECETLIAYRPVTDATLLAELSHLAEAAYRAVGCRDAGRVDIRLDEQGTLYLLELNPLPGLHPTHSDLPIIATQSGMAYAGLVAQIMSHFRLRMETGRV